MRCKQKIYGVITTKHLYGPNSSIKVFTGGRLYRNNLNAIQKRVKFKKVVRLEQGKLLKMKVTLCYK